MEAGHAQQRDKLLEQIQNDLKNLSLESKKYKSLQPLREATEEAIVKVRSLHQQQPAPAATSEQPLSSLFQMSNQILYPLVQGCESKEAKVIRLCLGLMQRLIIHKMVDFKGARYITDTLWMLMEAGVEEVKILQTLTLLLTSTGVVQHETLAKCLVICFRLHFTKDPSLNTIAGATVRQLVPVVFERVGGQTGDLALHEEPSPAFQQLLATQALPKDTDPFVVDAYLMFQDIVLLVSADQPVWLTGIVEMTRSFGLELLESILKKFSRVFAEHAVFQLLLKERVCSLVIKLFSPNIKYRAHAGAGGGGAPQSAAAAAAAGQTSQDKPYYPITSKLLRVVSILILDYHHILTTETEIFLSLIMKFLDPGKPMWQNCMALEVVHKIMVKPDLLVFICTTFDMNSHSTKVFQDIVNGLGAYVQNVMLMAGESSSSEPPPQGHSAASSVAPGHLVGSGVLYGGAGPGVAPQPGFYYRNVWKPLTISFVGGQTKELFLDLMERNDVPSVSDGYGISLAYACLLDAVRSMSLLMKEKERHQQQQQPCWNQLIESSWCGVLAALSLLLDASTDDTSTENILKSMETYASICGRLELTKPRDAYLASICKASLPPHYTLNVLKATPCTQTVSGPAAVVAGGGGSGGGGGGFDHSAAAAVALSENDIRHQVVAVGTPLPTASLPASAHQGPVMLTAKNLQCMRAILSVAHCHGNLLGQSWHIILTTLQHLVWILGLKPVTGGGLSSSSAASATSASAPAASAENNSSVITTAVMADLPVLSNMVTRLFESSNALSEASLGYLIEALCKLSEESMDLATSNREPSLFAVAKLLETAQVNLDRIDFVWRSITSHLLVVCQHPHLRMRQWGCEAVTFLTKQALQHRFEPPLPENNRLQVLLLSPLASLCGIPYPDVRQKQLDTVLHILHSSGVSLSQGWPLVLTMVGSIEPTHSDILIRSAFQCLQLVFTDFLPSIPFRCYPQCVDVATKFGSQETELNVSLTAVGLLWNLSDYFFQNVKTLQAQTVTTEKGAGAADHQIFPEFPGCKNIPAFDKLWMCLYYKLRDLCLDSRPAVRKSSGQTLFSTIAAHGSVLEANTWQAVLWQVLFPLLDNVIIQSDNASSEKVVQSKVIMMHHSRNTAQKQWAETKVLTISGVVRVFNTKRKLLKNMDDYAKAWLLLLEYVEKMALSETTEVALAALKSMQEMILTSATATSATATSASEEPRPTATSKSQDSINWTLCWKAWLNIGAQKTKYIANTNEVMDSHSHLLLTGFIQIFLTLFPYIEAGFRTDAAESLGNVLLSCVQIPVSDGGGSASISGGGGDMDSLSSSSGSLSGFYHTLTPVHAMAMEAVRKAEKVALDGSRHHSIICEVFDIYFKFARAAFTGTSGGSGSSGGGGKFEHDLRYKEKMSSFGEASLEQIGAFFLASCKMDRIPLDRILFRIVEVLKTPLRLKYACFRQSNWRVAINVLLKVLKEGFPLVRLFSSGGNGSGGGVDKFRDFWTELSQVLELFLFPDSLSEQKQEDRMADEAVDCHLIELLRDQVLPYPKAVPAEFIRKIVILLNKGSIHSSIQLNEDCSGSVGLREDLAKQCFETLLDFSLLRNDDAGSGESAPTSPTTPGADGGEESSLTNKLAITSLLQRFKEVLVDAIDGEKLNRNIPLQRQKTAEIAFVLRAIATVISSMKRASHPRVDRKTWQQVIALYPYLVQCTETNSAQVSSSVKDALLEYHDLLQPRDS